MKQPYVIYTQNQEIKLTKEEFERYLRDAYEAGRKDGYNDRHKECYNTIDLDWYLNPNTD